MDTFSPFQSVIYFAAGAICFYGGVYVVAKRQ